MLKNKVYDFLKWFTMCFSLFITFVETVFPVWGVSDATIKVITVTIGGLGTLLVGILAKSNYSYKKSGDAKVDGEDMK